MTVVAADDSAVVLRQRLAEAERQLGVWKASASQCAQAACFSPRMCEFLKDMATTELTKALLAVDHVDRVRWISCSFPSIERDAPQLDLLEWTSLSDTLWDLQWSPKWSIDIVVEATGPAYISCTLEVRLSRFSIRGQLRQSFAPDLSSVKACFATTPAVAFDVDCSASWGVVPLPIEGAVEQQIREQMQEFLQEHGAGLLTHWGQGGRADPLARRFLRVPTHLPLRLHAMEVTDRRPPWLTGRCHPRYWVHPRATSIVLADERAWASFDAAAADRATAAANGVSQIQM